MILVVDDNLDDIELTKIALHSTWPDLEIKAAMDGKSALDLLRLNRDTPPSLILLDSKMPGMSGVDTLTAIRGDNMLKEIPVIIVTSSLLPSEREEALEAGANAFLHKDFSFEAFRGQLNQLVGEWLTLP